MATITGTTAPERLRGTEGDDEIEALAGDDTLDGRGGDDTLRGGLGDDRFLAGEGDDLMTGGQGFDTVDYRKTAMAVTIQLDTGHGGGGAFGDEYFTIEGFVLTAGDDVFDGGEATFGAKVWGGAGKDHIQGGLGGDTLEGGAGRDYINGSDGFDFVSFAGARAGVTVDLTSHSGTGDAEKDIYDFVEGFILSAHDDVFVAGPNTGVIAWDVRAGEGRDAVTGSFSSDHLFGEGGRDTLFGANGADALDGGGDGDALRGGLGADTLTGGEGADRFLFNHRMESGVDGVDLIADFEAGVDLVDLRAVDADAIKAGDQAFQFVGAFTGKAREATLTFDGTTTTFRGDVDGDGDVDMEILLTGEVTATDGWLL